jgi:hypothetical protein
MSVHDIKALRDDLAALQGRHDDNIDELHARLDALMAVVTALTTRVDQNDTRISTLQKDTGQHAAQIERLRWANRRRTG